MDTVRHTKTTYAHISSSVGHACYTRRRGGGAAFLRSLPGIFAPKMSIQTFDRGPTRALYRTIDSNFETTAAILLLQIYYVRCTRYLAVSTTMIKPRELFGNSTIGRKKSIPLSKMSKYVYIILRIQCIIRLVSGLEFEDIFFRFSFCFFASRT